MPLLLLLTLTVTFEKLYPETAFKSFSLVVVLGRQLTNNLWFGFCGVVSCDVAMLLVVSIEAIFTVIMRVYKLMWVVLYLEFNMPNN